MTIKHYMLSIVTDWTYRNLKLTTMERTDFSANAVGTPRIKKEESHGFELLNGSGVVTGKLYGGCIDSLYDDYTGERYGEENKVFAKMFAYMHFLLYLCTLFCVRTPYI